MFGDINKTLITLGFFYTALFGVTLIFASTPSLARALQCVRMATEEDVRKLKELNGTVLPVGTCLDTTMTQKLGLDTGAPEALKYLESKVCPGKKVGYDSNIAPAILKETRVYFSAPQQGMDPKFIQCAAKFIQAAEMAGLSPCINAALRSQAHQLASCKDPNNKTVCGRTSSNPIQCRNDFSTCPHVNGRGIDLNSLNGSISKIVTLANSGQYGIKMGVSGAYDPWHMEPTGTDCLGSVQTPPPLSGTQSYTTPTSPLTQAIRSALGVPTQPQTAIPQQTFATPQSPISAFTQPSTATAGTPTTEPGVDFTNFTGTPQSTSTTANQLEDLLSNNKATTSTSTGLKVPLIINPNDRSDRVASVTPTTTQKTAQAWTQAPVPSTFISNDIAWTGEVTNAQGTGTLNSYTRILTSIRDALLQLLSRLRPFGGRPTVEYAE